MTKLPELKAFVYTSTETSTTKQLKKQEPELVKGLDLRLKKNWEYMVTQLKSIPPTLIPDTYSIEDYDQMLEEYQHKCDELFDVFDQKRNALYVNFNNNEEEDAPLNFDISLDELRKAQGIAQKQLDDELDKKSEQLKLIEQQRIEVKYAELQSPLSLSTSTNEPAQYRPEYYIPEYQTDDDLKRIDANHFDYYEARDNDRWDYDNPDEPMWDDSFFSPAELYCYTDEDGYEHCEVPPETITSLLCDVNKRAIMSLSHVTGEDRELYSSLIRAKYYCECKDFLGIDDDQIESNWTRVILEAQFIPPALDIS